MPDASICFYSKDTLLSLITSDFFSQLWFTNLASGKNRNSGKEYQFLCGYRVLIGDALALGEGVGVPRVEKLKKTCRVQVVLLLLFCV